jgi:uncharacterized lipoprotein YddW (UPF0748 family)
MIIGLVFSFAIPLVSLSQPFKDKELRGTWITNVDSDVFFKRDRLQRAVQDLKRLNFNTLYPVVWNWGYTLYPSQVAKKEFGESVLPRKTGEILAGKEFDRDEGLAGRDILREIIQESKKQKLAVIPWFEFGFMLNAPSDQSGSKLASLHPDWLTQKQDGSTVWKEGTHDRVWLNPLHPQAQNFIRKLVVEIVKNYDVDGIQFDDHFGYPFEFGYDPLTVKLYQQEHQGKLPPTNAKDPDWIEWRSSKITDFLAVLFKDIKQAKPKAIVSLSPNPQGFSKSFFLADWEKWERKGLIEELIIQVYRDSLTSFSSELDKPEVVRAKTRIPVGIGILSGIKPRSVTMTQIQQQVEAVRGKGLAGVSFFFYETLWQLSDQPANYRQYKLGQIFPKPIDRPSIIK